MKNRILFPLISAFLLLGSNSFAQKVIRQSPCLSPAILMQADSIKQFLSKQGFTVVKEASMQMVSEYEMPVIVPLTEGSWYQFVFIGDAGSRLYEVRMYDWNEKQVVYQKKYWGDVDGNIISSRPDRKPSSETPMHLEVYKARDDVRAVVHAHPIFATTLTVADLEFPVDVLPEVLLTLGNVPITAYATPSSHEDAVVIRPFLKDHNALLLCQHGSLTYGKNLDEALIHLERIEHVSEIYWRAKMLGTVKRVPPETQAQLVLLREKYFKG